MENIKQEIKELIAELGDKITIPAHHYQHPDVVEFADFIGDSYKLAVDCAKAESEFVVFCGVRFMAEGAAVLAKEGQKVLIPEPDAGCPMADMISAAEAEEAFDKISKLTTNPIVPVFYMNSYADAKHFCGKHDGSICTSSNAGKIIKHYTDQGKAIFFAPDFNLGENTAAELGIKPEEIVKINRDFSLENAENAKTAKMFIWDGFCRVHQIFQVSDVETVRSEHPNIKVIVHPECSSDVVKVSDISGSTQKIYQVIHDADPGTEWAVGTEFSFVDRIAHEHPDRLVIPLRKSICYNMQKINLKNLHEMLLSIKEYYATGKEPIHKVSVTKEFKENAKRALQNMISIVEAN